MNRQQGSIHLNRAQYRILVVDDEPNVRNALVKALSLNGYDAHGAASGEDALEMLRTTPFTLMVLDMHMPPGMDGVTVMQKTRDIQPHLLILVLTAHPSVDNAIAAVKSRAVDFLRKPVSTRLLCDTVDNLLQRHAEQLRRDRLADAVSEAVEALQLPPAAAPATPNVNDDGETLHVSPLLLNRLRKYVVVDGTDEPIFISEGESVLLAFLMMHPNQVLSARQIAFQLVGDGSMSEGEAQRLVRPYLSRLRGKITILKTDRSILRTVRGRGYMFVPRRM